MTWGYLETQKERNPMDYKDEVNKFGDDVKACKAWGRGRRTPRQRDRRQKWKRALDKSAPEKKYIQCPKCKYEFPLIMAKSLDLPTTRQVMAYLFVELCGDTQKQASVKMGISEVAVSKLIKRFLKKRPCGLTYRKSDDMDFGRQTLRRTSNELAQNWPKKRRKT